MTFTDHLWNRITPIYEAILDHPFIRELADGTLPEEVFRFYMSQDALYLSDFSRALAMVGTRSKTNSDMEQFLDFARYAIAGERNLHERLYEEIDLAVDTKKSPACFPIRILLSRRPPLKTGALLSRRCCPVFGFTGKSAPIFSAVVARIIPTKTGLICMEARSPRARSASHWYDQQRGRSATRRAKGGDVQGFCAGLAAGMDVLGQRLPEGGVASTAG